MARIAVAVRQAPWDCKWTRGVPEYVPPDPRLWVCVRDPNAPTRVGEANCHECPHWEMDEGDSGDTGRS